MRKSIRWILFALTADNWQRDKLIDKDKMIERSMRKSIFLNVSFSKIIARFEAKFDVTKACFFVIILSSTDLCVHWSVLISLRWWYESSQYTDDVVYSWMSTRFWLIASDDLYVESVNHVTHANSIRSDYLSISLSRLIRSFVHIITSLMMIWTDRWCRLFRLRLWLILKSDDINMFNCF
jgi:hypothetical protein